MATKTNTAKTENVDNSTEQKDVNALHDEMKSVITKDHTTTSAKIRALDAAGYTRSQIANFLGKRYQHVRNVLVTPLSGKKSTKA